MNFTAKVQRVFVAAPEGWRWGLGVFILGMMLEDGDGMELGSISDRAGGGVASDTCGVHGGAGVVPGGGETGSGIEGV